MSDIETANRKMVDTTEEEWWHKTMRIEEKFYHGDNESLPWRLKCWWKSGGVPHCVHLFHPDGPLMETFYNTPIDDIKDYINRSLL